MWNLLILWFKDLLWDTPWDSNSGFGMKQRHPYLDAFFQDTYLVNSNYDI